MADQTNIPADFKGQVLIGRTFNRLTVIEFAKRKKVKGGTVIYWKCRCQCGQMMVAGATSLLGGNTQSCGCYQRERAATSNYQHGWASRKGKHRLYRLWEGMKERCQNPNHQMWKHYGGKGIRVCERWLDFENFRIDMEASWKPGLSLDRRSCSDNYSPETVRWATSKEQGQNKTNNRLITFNGRTQTQQMWADETGIARQAIYHRLKRGWAVEKALTTPSKRSQFFRCKKNVVVPGKILSQAVFDYL